jgi:hypothetical protein
VEARLLAKIKAVGGLHAAKRIIADAPKSRPTASDFM